MKLVHGDLFESTAESIVVTACGVVESGRLSLTGGASKRAAELWPTMPALAGSLAQSRPRGPTPGTHTFGLLWVGPHLLGGRQVELYLLQVMYRHEDTASLELIGPGIAELGRRARSFPTLRFAVNFPGIGHGGLTQEQVAPLLADLPDNVEVHLLP